jgi:cytidine deaminase
MNPNPKSGDTTPDSASCVAGLAPQQLPASLSAPQIQAMWQAAQAARQMAYAPYSRFLVGAAVMDEQGRIHGGCNVENAAYPQGVCAEAGALSAMVLAGGRRLRAALVLGEGGAHSVTPCGGCRQKLREFGAADLPVFMANGRGLQMTVTLEQLLPHSFGPEHLASAELK